MGFLKHVLKPYDNRSHRQFDIVEIAYDFSMSRAARTLKIACDNRKQKSYRVNRPLQTSPQYRHLSIMYSSCGPVGTEIHISKFSICNTGTSKVQPVCCVPLMSVLKRFNCINYVLPNPCDTAPLSYSHLFSRSCFLFRFHPVERPASKTIKDIFRKYNVYRLYAVVQFCPWFKFCLLYSCVWLHMIMSKKQRKIKIELRIKLNHSIYMYDTNRPSKNPHHRLRVLRALV